MTGVQILDVHVDDTDQRLDRWLRRHFPQLKQGQIEKLCRKGSFRIDGGRAKPSTRLLAGQQIRIPPLPSAQTIPPKPATIPPADQELMRNALLYQDDHIIALNKPAGLPVQGGSKQTRHIDALSSALVDEDAPRPKLVHRLDRDTSGVLLLAKTAQAAKGLANAFKNRNTRKIYWAAVAGVPKPAMGTIRYGLQKAAGHSADTYEKMQIIHPDQIADSKGAKHATTDYAVLDGLANRVAWVALVPITGRTHQLRAHMAALGHPIVGDGKYGTRAQVNMGDGWGAQLGGEISRKLHLHARYLQLSHPITGETLSFSAPLPTHMQNTWQALDWNPKTAPVDPFLDSELFS